MIYEFGQFEVDIARFELRRENVVQPVEPQVLTVLLYLIEHRHRLVSKNELFEKLWDGRVVTDSVLTSRIKSARQALGDTGKTQDFIKTIYGKGFRFVPEVRIRSDIQPLSILDTSPEPDTVATTHQSTRPSIAVLPFKNLAEAGDYRSLAEGLPHELITELARLRWLMVIARGSSFRLRDPDLDVRDIGSLLGVRYCLSGAVEVNGLKIAVTTELADTRTGEIVWNERYTGFVDDIHAVRAEIRSKILTSLEVRIPMHEASAARLVSTENLDAWSAYHLGLQHLYRFNRNDNAIATRLFEHAVKQDEHFARAHAGLSFVHFQNAFMRQTDDMKVEVALAHEHAQRGLDIDPIDPFANFTMGRSYWLSADLDNAQTWLERATALSPNYAQGMYALAWTKTISGATQDGRDELDLAMRLSPLDPLYYAMLGARGFTHIAKGEYVEASVWTERAARAPDAHVFMALLAAVTFALAANDAKATVWAKQVKKRGPLINKADFFRGYPIQAEPMRSNVDRALVRLGF
ncbi:MAG: winged helix-turn-helix domain-containing tetratricopeptide repeat protein [Woeseiaceae bacterium]